MLIFSLWDCYRESMQMERLALENAAVAEANQRLAINLRGEEKMNFQGIMNPNGQSSEQGSAAR